MTTDVRDRSPHSAAAGARTPQSAALVAASASAAAGLVHAAAAGTHGGDSTLVWCFALTAAAQLAWAAWMLLAPSRSAALVGIVLNGGAALAWVASRTVGLVGPLDDIEAVGTQDLLAALLGATAAVAAAAALRARAAHARPVVFAVVVSAVLVGLAIPAMASEHTHGASHDHASGHGGGHQATDVRDHADADSERATDPHDHAADEETGPIVSIDDPRLTTAQRQAARSLLDSTRQTLARLPDEATVEAAGYRSIGDGRAVGRFEHFVNPAYLRDGRELDPDAIESIVLQVQPDGTKRVMSAMFILEPTKTMADVPEIAGELTTWHDHQNLCFDGTGRLTGVLRDGACFPGGTLRLTPPMLHVWLDDPACGPFTGVEGHGGADCDHAHAA